MPRDLIKSNQSKSNHLIRDAHNLNASLDPCRCCSASQPVHGPGEALPSARETHWGGGALSRTSLACPSPKIEQRFRYGVNLSRQATVLLVPIYNSILADASLPLLRFLHALPPPPSLPRHSPSQPPFPFQHSFPRPPPTPLSPLLFVSPRPFQPSCTCNLPLSAAHHRLTKNRCSMPAVQVRRCGESRRGERAPRGRRRARVGAKHPDAPPRQPVGCRYP